MPDHFPLDLIVTLEDTEPFHDSDLTLGTFRAEVEVMDTANWILTGVFHRRPSDGAWVRPASGGVIEAMLNSAAVRKTGWDQIEAAITDKLADLRTGAMAMERAA